MYVRERPGTFRSGDAGQNDLRSRAGEGSSDAGAADSSDPGERAEVRRFTGASMRRWQQAADAPSLFTRAVGSVINLVRVAEFEILFISLFVLAVLLFKDLTARPEYNQILFQRRLEPEQIRLY